MVDTTGQAINTIHSTIQELKNTHKEEEKTLDFYNLPDEEIFQKVKSEKYRIQSMLLTILYNGLGFKMIFSEDVHEDLTEKQVKGFISKSKINPHPKLPQRKEYWLQHASLYEE